MTPADSISPSNGSGTSTSTSTGDNNRSSSGASTSGSGSGSNRSSTGTGTGTRASTSISAGTSTSISAGTSISTGDNNRSSSGSRGHTRSACETFAARKFSPLPATREETQHIARLWHQGADGQHRVEILSDDQASEAAFKAMAPGRRVLHLATHGFFLDRTCSMSSKSATDDGDGTGARTRARGTQLLEESPLLRSGLVLAGANQRAQAHADEEDGIVTAEEIAGLNLSDTQWAVLSACDTGGGDWQPSEGVLGLRRAFEVAGARTVILSLWPVIDTVASQWMTELYREKFLHRTQTAIAVRTASRKLLAARRTAGQNTHPLYWSRFIATGDWR